jgi:predicted RND superfamily exporter protein
MTAFGDRTLREMVIASGLKRIRPCLMTTATTVVGLMPVFLTQGRGSDIMQPMAIPSVGGMAVSAVTIFVVPALYCLVQEMKLKRRLRREGLLIPTPGSDGQPATETHGDRRANGSHPGGEIGA